MHMRFLISSAITAVGLSMFVAPVQAQTASATVCVDGTTSTAVGKDLCAGHGGVKAKSTSTVSTHVTCVDGMVADAGRGACADHGGVKSRSSTTSTKTISKTTVRPEDKDATGAIALCKDGLYSHAVARADACKAHGGVDRFLKA